MRRCFCFMIAVLAVFAMADVSTVRAADAACKGLATEACSGNGSCSWVKPYKTKKGKEIAGFCRKKVGKKSTQAKTAG
jgi:hypothetical protein